MEFFREVHSPGLDLDYLKSLLSIDSLTGLCAAIDSVAAHNENEAEIYCLWGLFNIRRDVIKYGVRFSLLNCPHALAWTITFNEASQKIIIHCTIDKTEEDPDFIESIHNFLADWSNGMARALQ